MRGIEAVNHAIAPDHARNVDDVVRILDESDVHYSWRSSNAENIDVDCAAFGGMETQLALGEHMSNPSNGSGSSADEVLWV